MPHPRDPAADPLLSTPCRGCGASATLRRGRCARCYERWLSSRPVGLGALCACCSDRRTDNLRYFELHRFWVILCHNCNARASRLRTLPRSVEGLLASMSRNRRRRPDRRKASAAETGWYQAIERRRQPRRTVDRKQQDELDRMGDVIELEVDFAAPIEDADPVDGPITSVHILLSPGEL